MQFIPLWRGTGIIILIYLGMIFLIRTGKTAGVWRFTMEPLRLPESWFCRKFYGLWGRRSCGVCFEKGWVIVAVVKSAVIVKKGGVF